MASTKTPSFQPPSAVIKVEDRPLQETFTLPDLTPISVHETKDQKIVVSIGEGVTNTHDFPTFKSKHELEGQQLRPIIEFVPISGRRSQVSLHGVVNDDRVKDEQVWEMIALDEKVNFEDIWSALYAFWIRRDEHDNFPIQVGKSFTNAEKVFRYLTYTALGIHAPDAKDDHEVLLNRSTFWQGAGAPLSRSWLRSPQPHPAAVGDLMSTSFPYMLAFTRGDNVLTTHPVRPPKPPPGAIVYSRYIHSVGAHLQFTHIDPSNKEHFSKFSSWMNSDRVNAGWKEKGDEQHHRDFLDGRMKDPHNVSYISSWDGEFAGYGEFSWSKEDGVAAFVGGLDDYDQGTHSLVGEDKFRGKHRFAHMMLSMKHFCFLREPRTQVVIGEPRTDLHVVQLLKAYVPQEVVKEVELPHKRASLFKLRRDRFFTDGMFY
ncbi:hypothetical protein CBS101457_003191 [Exobasidium rhododendri]|nr:hypothetical protein CBS101457_003191 [Exobasidium rhododendri]